MINAIKRFALTTAYITRLPICTLPATGAEHQLAGLSKYLPAVGLLVGSLLALLALALNSALGKGPFGWMIEAAVLAVFWLLVTGGIHFDGLMDTADGIFSHRDQARTLEIMADSRVGNFGAMTGWCVLLLKFASLFALCSSKYWMALLLVPAWARWCETYAIGAFPYLRAQGMGKIWHDTTSFPRDPLLAAIPPLLVTAFLLYQYSSLIPVLITLFTIVTGLSLSYWLNRRLNGQTGDTYGACVEIAETGGLFLFAVATNCPYLSWLFQSASA